MLSKNSKIAVLNGDVFLNNRFVKADILIKNKLIDKVIHHKSDIKDLSDYKIIDAEGSYVSYGFLDPHVHFRFPGMEYKEDWETGANAGISGGFTFVIDMPNTNPPAINASSLIEKHRSIKTILNHGYYIGLTDENADDIKNIIKILKKNKVPVFGIKIFLGSSTGSLLIKNNESLKKSLSSENINLFHCEDEEVLKKFDGISYNNIYDHEKKRPSESEVSAIKRILVNSDKRSKIYICHVSSKALTEEIKKAKDEDYKIISEITPHHLYFSTENIKESNIYKVNPPIRNENDVRFLREKFNEGFFDLIGTDHAPHSLNEKLSANPPSGFPGLESAFYALYSLYEKNILSLEMIFKCLTNGYRIFNIKKRGEIKRGNYADLTIIKKEKNIFKSDESQSKAKFSPFDSIETNAKINIVMIDGKIVLENNKLYN